MAHPNNLDYIVILFKEVYKFANQSTIDLTNNEIAHFHGYRSDNFITCVLSMLHKIDKNKEINQDDDVFYYCVNILKEIINSNYRFSYQNHHFLQNIPTRFITHDLKQLLCNQLNTKEKKICLIDEQFILQSFKQFGDDILKMYKKLNIELPFSAQMNIAKLKPYSVCYLVNPNPTVIIQAIKQNEHSLLLLLDIQYMKQNEDTILQILEENPKAIQYMPNAKKEWLLLVLEKDINMFEFIYSSEYLEDILNSVIMPNLHKLDWNNLMKAKRYQVLFAK